MANVEALSDEGGDLSVQINLRIVLPDAVRSRGDNMLQVDDDLTNALFISEAGLLAVPTKQV